MRKSFHVSLSAKEKEKCLKEDELNNLLKSHSIISQFTENDIIFNPTYKYDKQSRNYDSSAKKRKPAWTDRILYKSNGIKCHSYDEIYEVLVSDHRPVYADFSVKVSNLFTLQVNFLCLRSLQEMFHRLLLLVGSSIQQKMMIYVSKSR